MNGMLRRTHSARHAAQHVSADPAANRERTAARLSARTGPDAAARWARCINAARGQIVSGSPSTRTASDAGRTLDASGDARRNKQRPVWIDPGRRRLGPRIVSERGAPAVVIGQGCPVRGQWQRRLGRLLTVRSPAGTRRSRSLRRGGSRCLVRFACDHQVVTACRERGIRRRKLDQQHRRRKSQPTRKQILPAARHERG